MEGNLQEKQNQKKQKTEQSESAHSKLICMFSLDYILTSDIIPDTEIPYSCWWSVCVGVGVWNFESPKEIQTGLWEDDVWLKSHLWSKFFFFFFLNFFLRFFFFFEREMTRSLELLFWKSRLTGRLSWNTGVCVALSQCDFKQCIESCCLPSATPPPTPPPLLFSSKCSARSVLVVAWQQSSWQARGTWTMCEPCVSPVASK